MLAVQNVAVGQASLSAHEPGSKHLLSSHGPKALVTLLISHSSYRAKAFLTASKRLGLDAVVITDAQQASELLSPGSVMSAPLEDPEHSVRLLTPVLSRQGIKAVVGVDDSTLATASLLARSLGCPHVSPEAVAKTQDKHLTRITLSAAGLRQPRFALAQPTSPSSLARAVETVGLPCVLKPRSLSGSQGVIRANNLHQVQKAGLRIAAILKRSGLDGQEILLESYVPGKEYAIDAIVLPQHAEPEVLAIFDKPEPMTGPFFAETIYTTPSRAPQWVQRTMTETLAKAVEALRIDRGPIHAELRVCQDNQSQDDNAGQSDAGQPGPACLIEVATRTIGGRCSEMLSFASRSPLDHLGSLAYGGEEDSYSLEELVLASALGISLAHQDTLPAGVLMLQVPAKGRFSGIHGRDAIASLPRIVGMEMSIHPGERVEPLPEGNRYAGFVFAKTEAGFDPSGVDHVAKVAKVAQELRIIEDSLRRAQEIADIEVIPSN